MVNPLNVAIDIHVDGAVWSEIQQFSFAAGYTFNPSLFRKLNVKDYESACRDIVSEVGGKPVSLEVIADDFPEMERQALKLHALGLNVLVKIPITLTDGTSTAPLVNDLSAAGVKVNVTAVTTAKQVTDVLNIAHRPYVISIFAGRLADSGIDPCDLMRGAASVCRPCKVRTLWASTREPLDIYKAYRCGTDIITVPPAILQKAVAKAGKDMTAESLEVVRMFHADAKAAGYSL